MFITITDAGQVNNIFRKLARKGSPILGGHFRPPVPHFLPKIGHNSWTFPNYPITYTYFYL